MFYYRDLTFCQYPLFYVLKSEWAHTWLPLWDRFHGLGQPLLANPIFMSLYPLTQLLRFTDPPTYMNVFIPLHWMICVAGMYRLLRAFGRGTLSSWFGALLFGLSGPFVSATVQPMLLLPLAYIPWVLFFVVRAAQTGLKRHEIGAAVCLCFVIVAGELASILSVSILLCAVAGTRPTKRLSGWAFGRIAILALLLSGPQLVPAIELRSESGRSAGFSYGRISAHSLPPVRLVETMLPGFFGDPLSSSPAVYRGYRVFGEAPYLPSIFLGGLAVLVLLAFGMIDRDRACWVLAAAAALFLVLSLGKYGFLHRALADSISVLRSVRYPEKFLVFFSAVVSLLAARGVEVLLSDRRTRLALVLPLAALACAITGYAAFPVARAPLIPSLLSLSLIAMGLLLRRGALSVAGLLIVLIGLFLHAGSLNPKIPGLPPDSALAQTIGHDSVARYADAASLALAPPDDSPVWGILWDRQTLNYSTASEFGISTPFERDVAAIYIHRQRILYDLFNSLPPAESLRLARLYSCRWAITSSFDQADVETAAAIRTPTIPYSPPLYLARLKGPVQEPAALRYGTRSTSSLPETIRAVLAPDFDWQTTALVEGDAGSEQNHDVPGTIQGESGTTADKTYEVQLVANGFLILNQSYYPGWSASVDGTLVDVRRANLLVMAVAVDKGRHEVRVFFAPGSFRIGVSMFVAGLIGIAVLVGVSASWSSCTQAIRRIMGSAPPAL